MRTKDTSPPFIKDVLAYARLAPSVHNTQPWRFTTTKDTVALSVAPQRMLQAGDPTQRELWLSLGACLETLLQASLGLGYEATITRLQTKSLSKSIAILHFKPINHKESPILSAIKNRVSYRGKMYPVTLKDDFFTPLNSTAADLSDVSIMTLTDTTKIHRVAELTYKGMSLAMSSPEFRTELSELVHPNWTKAHVGMPGYTLNRGLLGSAWEKWSIKHGFSLDAKARKDQQKIEEASCLIFIATSGDIPSFWLTAGRTYMRVALEIEKAGFAQSTLAAPIEAASFHEDIEKLLHTSYRIQAMIRVGGARSRKRNAAPRLTLEELHSL